ncbi:DUF222 domain-containing protein [Geodermatophilus sp. SYSU D00696]
MEVAEHRSPVEQALLDAVIATPARFRRLPVGLLSREQKAAELQRVAALKAMTAAYEAELVLGLADDSPDDDDPAPGTPGARTGSWAPDTELPGVSEFFTAELAMVLNCGRGTANHLAHRAWTYRERLPATWAALAAGDLDEARAKALVDVLEHAPAGIARRIEAALLPAAAQWTVGRLKQRALALLLDLDADAVGRRKQQARRRADVRVDPSPLAGMATLAADLPAEVAAACHALVDSLARMLKADGDERPIGELRCAVLADLIQRPWQTGPAVTAQLTIIATLAALAGDSEEAGEVNGLPITAAHLRELLRELDALGVRAPEGGSVTVALTDADGTLRATGTLDRLRRLAARGCPDHPDTTDEPDCGCPVLDRPDPVDRYTPTPAQQAFVRTRDRACRFATCGQRVGWADADHVLPHARGGVTDCANLCCLCRSHHRLKTFARGWRFTMSDDGTLTVTTPSGITRTTRPPGTRPPPVAEPPPDDTGSPPPSVEPDDDPPVLTEGQPVRGSAYAQRASAVRVPEATTVNPASLTCTGAEVTNWAHRSASGCSTTTGKPAPAQAARRAGGIRIAVSCAAWPQAAAALPSGRKGSGQTDTTTGPPGTGSAAAHASGSSSSLPVNCSRPTSGGSSSRAAGTSARTSAPPTCAVTPGSAATRSQATPRARRQCLRIAPSVHRRTCGDHSPPGCARSSASSRTTATAAAAHTAVRVGGSRRSTRATSCSAQGDSPSGSACTPPPCPVPRGTEPCDVGVTIT